MMRADARGGDAQRVRELGGLALLGIAARLELTELEQLRRILAAASELGGRAPRARRGQERIEAQRDGPAARDARLVQAGHRFGAWRGRRRDHSLFVRAARAQELVARSRHVGLAASGVRRGLALASDQELAADLCRAFAQRAIEALLGTVDVDERLLFELAVVAEDLAAGGHAAEVVVAA